MYKKINIVDININPIINVGVNFVFIRVEHCKGCECSSKPKAINWDTLLIIPYDWIASLKVIIVIEYLCYSYIFWTFPILFLHRF